MPIKYGLLAAVIAVAAWSAGTAATTADPLPAQAAGPTCDDHPNQASAQRARDTRDADGDGIYCETLSCPCLPPDPRADGDGQNPPPDSEPTEPSCTRPRGIQRLVFDAGRYPNIRRHVRSAIRNGWPRRLILNRRGTDARRDRLLENYPTREGMDRDEYPPALGRGRGQGLERGRNPRGWRASVRYVPRSENRSHGATLGNMLEDWCNGTRFRYAFR